MAEEWRQEEEGEKKMLNTCIKKVLIFFLDDKNYIDSSFSFI